MDWQLNLNYEYMKDGNSKWMNLKIQMYFDIFLNEVLEYITTGNKEQMLRNRKHTSSFDKVYTIKVHTIEMPFLKQKYVSLIVSQNVTTEQKIDLLKTCVLYLGKAVLSEGLTANLAYLNNKY